MKHKEPQRAIDWRVCPKFCHTCSFYNADGVCLFYKSEPPEDFAKTENACPKWEFEMPF